MNIESLNGGDLGLTLVNHKISSPDFNWQKATIPISLQVYGHTNMHYGAQTPMPCNKSCNELQFRAAWTKIEA